ncbi:MAG TPA: hypothetical protein VLS94_07915 [Fusibacter sp.]|nr:hypothetical protein [Fusibacter sp.]
MYNKKTALKVSSLLLLAISLLDIIRGFMHTFNIKWAAENIAKIEAIPDSMILMGSFGMSNFLTGFIYLLILWKAKNLAPHVLALIPIAYGLGIIGLKLQGIAMESEFNGQYMMFVYLGLCALTSIYYFLSSKMEASNETSI